MSAPASGSLDARRPTASRRVASRIDVIFLATVALPTLVATLYFGVVASDVYISESRFLVRSPDRDTPAATGLTALLAGSSFSRATDDTYSVHDYVQSRDASNELDRSMHLRTVFGSKDVDIFSRFAGLRWDASLEQFYLYYQDKVDIEYDPESSITVLDVRAYTAKDSQDINEHLIGLSEQLLNKMNERSRHDLVDEAEHEVRVAEQADLDATVALTDLRSSGRILDPAGEGAIELQRLAKMRDDLLAAETQLDQVRRLSPTNPQIPALTGNIDTQRRAVATQSASLTGKGEGSLNAKSGPLTRVSLQKDFADRTLQTALVNLDSARTEVQRKHLYLERIVQPNLPDHAMEPRRVRGIAMVLAVGLLAWGVVSLITASVREHVD